MNGDVVTLCKNHTRLILERWRRGLDEVEEPVSSWLDMGTVLNVVERPKSLRTRVVSLIEQGNVSFFRLQPDDVRIDFVATWQKKEPSIALKLFLELLDEELPAIREKTRYLSR